MNMKLIPKLTEKEIDRFWSKVDINGDDDCWNWIPSVNKSGYCSIGFSRDKSQIMYYSHRVSLFLYTNKQGAIARHSCDNVRCCNPKHLSWGSQQDNVDDMISKDRHPRGSRHGSAILSESDVILIRKDFKDKGNKQLCDIFGVTRSAISNIISGNRWKHI